MARGAYPFSVGDMMGARDETARQLARCKWLHDEFVEERRALRRERRVQLARLRQARARLEGLPRRGGPAHAGAA